jgi:NAD(P)-dependent dehydrogenase (short-subunit alcohol dehydrogenase family)
MVELEDKTALVTGGAQGIGFGIAMELARAGSHIVIADQNLPKVNAAADEIRRSTRREVIALALDVTDEDSVKSCVQICIDRVSRIDVLVNNAGVHRERIGQVSTIENFWQCFDVNLFGVWRVTQALVPHFKANRGGKIINIASINGRTPWADTPAYSASKAALINLTQSLAIKLAADDINVNAVCPGGVITPMARALAPDLQAMEREILDRRLLKRPLLPEDIGHAVVFLASSRSRNITGQALNVDGGVVLS